MRIESGGLPLNPEKGNTIQDGTRKKPEKSGGSAKFRDRVSISDQARDLQAGQSDRAEDGHADLERDRSDLKEIRERLDSEYYDTKQAILTVAVRVLEVFGL